MIGVILTGGLGTRMNGSYKERGITARITNKHVLPIYDGEECIPMILLPIMTLVNAGIKDICIVTGGRYKGQIIDYLGNGKEFGIDNLTYAFQHGEGGIPDALYTARHVAKGQNVVCILGDNYFDDFDLKSYLQNWEKEVDDVPTAGVFLTEREDANRFGVVEFDDVGNIKCLVEKPKDPPTKWCATGLYLFDKKLFDIIPEQKQSSRKEFEVVDTLTWYLKNGILTYKKFNSYWSDCGSPKTIFEVSNYLASKKANK